jgi:hypothetical protein
MKFEFTEYTHVYGVAVPIEVTAVQFSTGTVRVLSATVSGVPMSRTQLLKFEQEHQASIVQCTTYMKDRTMAVLGDYDAYDY